MIKLMVLGLAAWAAVAPAQEVDLLSVQIRKPAGEDARELVFGTGNPEEGGIDASLLIRAAEGFIASVDENASRVTEVVDADSGAPVAKKLEFGSFPRISESGKSALVEIEMESKPDYPARLRLRGAVTVKKAGGVETLKTAVVEGKKGQSIGVGVHTLKIGDFESGADGSRIELKSSKSLVGLKALRFLKPDGTVMEGERSGSSWSSGGGNVSESWTYTVEGKLDQFIIEAAVFVNLETVDVPFEIVIPGRL